MKLNNIPQNKYIIVNNYNNDATKGNGYNVYEAAYKYCNLGEILVYMNGNDSFIGRQVLSTLNTIYQK